MRTAFILAAAAATFLQVSATESAVQSRCTTCDKGALTPQQTPYPNAASYVAAVRAADEAAAAAAARYYGYSPVNPTDALIAGGRVSPAGLPYGKAGAKKDVNVSPNNVSPNDAAISAPPEELLGPFSGALDPFSGVLSAIESSVESSLLGKVTSLPASEASRFMSDIQSKESSILGIASLTSVSASTTGSPKPRASEKVDENVAGITESAEAAEIKQAKEKKGEEAGKEEDKKSGAGALLWESGSSIALVLFSFGIWLA